MIYVLFYLRSTESISLNEYFELHLLESAFFFISQSMTELIHLYSTFVQNEKNSSDSLHLQTLEYGLAPNEECRDLI